jgi:hypothetical protein
VQRVARSRAPYAVGNALKKSCLDQAALDTYRILNAKRFSRLHFNGRQATRFSRLRLCGRVTFGS